jgi:hypothetical protein
LAVQLDLDRIGLNNQESAGPLDTTYLRVRSRPELRVLPNVAWLPAARLGADPFFEVREAGEEPPIAW